MYDRYLYMKKLGIGIFEENENPIENSMNIELISPLAKENNLANKGVYVRINNNNRRLKFDISIKNSYNNIYKQFGQLMNLLINVDGNKDVFYFNPYKFYSTNTANGFSKYSNFVYLVRIVNQPSIQKNGNLASMTLVLEEVI